MDTINFDLSFWIDPVGLSLDITTDNITELAFNLDVLLELEL